MYDGLGEPQRALEYYGQALPILREVGDRAGEAVTRYNVAMIHRAQGELGRAVAELEQVVELDRQVGHPDLQSDTEMLHRVRQELASPDPGAGRDDVGGAVGGGAPAGGGRPGGRDRPGCGGPGWRGVAGQVTVRGCGPAGRADPDPG